MSPRIRYIFAPCSYNRQTFNNKMNEKKKPGVSAHGHPEYVTRQIDRRLEMILLFDFCTVLKIF